MKDSNNRRMVRIGFGVPVLDFHRVGCLVEFLSVEYFSFVVTPALKQQGFSPRVAVLYSVT